MFFVSNVNSPLMNASSEGIGDGFVSFRHAELDALLDLTFYRLEYSV